MQRRGKVRCALLSCLAVAGVVAFAGDVMVPEVTEMQGAQKILFSFGGGGEDAPAFLARSIGGEEQRATFRLPRRSRRSFSSKKFRSGPASLCR